MKDLFIDTGYSQACHWGERACGDAVAFRRIVSEDRLLCVMADGLGHGLKANILALMTTTMAIKFMAEDSEIVHFSEIIMDSLPVCQERHISYATFTILDTRPGGETRVVEMGNPPMILLRNGTEVTPASREVASPKYRDRAMTCYDFTVQPGDRIVFFSDGVSQAGLGTANLPTGWGRDGALLYARHQISAMPEISAQELSERLLREAIAHEPHLRPADDITAVTFHYRHPQKMLVFTGPPVDPARDADCVRFFSEFAGTKIICGGTSAEIVGRGLGKPVVPLPAELGSDLPPMSKLEGADLVTEGILTLNRAARYLEHGEESRNDPAGKIVELMRRHDVIEFMVGTKINQAHQDPNLPADLELRRNIVARIGGVLRDKYMKEVDIRFV